MAVIAERADGIVEIGVNAAGTTEAVANCSNACPFVLGRDFILQESPRNFTFAMLEGNNQLCTIVDFTGKLAEGDISFGKFPKCGMIIPKR